MQMPRPRFIVIVLVLLALNYFSVALLGPGREPSIDIPYNPTFRAQVEDGNVKRVSAQGETIEGEFKKAVKPPDDAKGKAAKNFETEIPTFANTDELSKLLEEHDVVVQAKPINSGGLLVNLLLGFGPVILLVGLFVFLARRAGGGGGLSGLGAFSRSRARRVEGGEQRDHLQRRRRHRRGEGRADRDRRLPQEPRALPASSAGGSRAACCCRASPAPARRCWPRRWRARRTCRSSRSRPRSSSRRSSASAPRACATCSRPPRRPRRRSSSSTSSTRSAARAPRASGFGGGNDEREQTLNQILTEMDGFESNVAVIVLGATNRPEILDQALLRPGRFDRRVAVPPPDKDGRRKILEVHTRSLPLGDDVDLDRIAATTPGMVGADLANLANEAALTAARRNHDKVQLADFTDALEKIVLGAPRGTVLSDEDRKRVAYHEAGHAIVGMLTPGADPVRKVSIIPRGMALGVTLSAPDLDKANYEEAYLLAKIKVALGGRVAEEIVYGTITTGAESDIQQLTGIARGDGRPLGDEPQHRADRRAAVRDERAAAARARPRCHPRRSG